VAHYKVIDEPQAVSTSDELPPREEFLRIIGAVDAKASPLLRILLSKCKPDAPLVDQVTAIEQLGRFILAGPSVPGVVSQELARLELLVVTLERIPSAARRFQATLRSVLSQMQAVRLFGEIGLPNDRGLLAETTDRLARKLLPEAPRPHELWFLCSHIVRKLDELKWLGPAADPLLHRLAAAGGDAWEPLRVQLLDAVGLITTRIAAIGMSEAFRMRGAATGLRESPLYHLTRAKPAEMPALIDASRKHLEHVKQALEETGVSIDVVYSLDSIERQLSRLEILLPFVDDSDELEPTYEIRAVIAALGRGLVGGRSFVQLLSDNLRLLARKVIERAGRSGEHYVTSSRGEYWTMLKSAFGGGLVIVFLTAGKFLIKWAHVAPFLDALLASAAYSGAFLIMQLLGLTLATKQPSMTAAALAGSIREHGDNLDDLVATIARIARSQFAAIVGNVAAVILGSLVFDAIYSRITGAPFLDRENAIHTAESLDPIRSWTIVLAILTGVQLWISSLCAGWFENWIVYRQLPAAIEHHRLGKRLGKERMARIARFLERHAAGFGGSISLGLLFGFLPQIGGFMGISLDGRHITITTTSLVLSTTSAGVDGLGTGTFVWGCLGLVGIALCNFGVSFTLALLVALRAREVPRGQRLRLPGAVLRYFLRHPGEFFFPPKHAAASHH
jgi:site-specific recombinase